MWHDIVRFSNSVGCRAVDVREAIALACHVTCMSVQCRTRTTRETIYDLLTTALEAFVMNLENIVRQKI